MPSAGRAFSGRVLEALRERGVAVEPITLHTGVASLEAPEPPYDEWYEVPRETAEAVRASAGWTDLVVTPERGVAAVDGLLTGFHEPRASHLQLLSAVAGVEHVRRVYAHALAQGYLWHEFGDLHLLLRGTGSGVVLDQRE
jgi:S-adenosylmethionine:tRNA ribosyltransferase-isomerase